MNLIDRDKLLDDLINRLPKIATIIEAALPVLICEQPVIKAAPITREQVEKMRGAWIEVSDVDGCTWSKCSDCGEDLDSLEDAYDFCPYCGDPMTDKAVDILWKRLKAFNAATVKEQTAVVDEKIKTAVRAGVFAIINSKYKNQIFWDDARGLRGGPYRMNFYEAATILLEFIGDLSLSEK